jgi:fructose-specific phosphotransferase system IIC component
MSLQDTFYLVGIIYMILFIIMVGVLIVLLFFIKNKIAELHDTIQERLDLLTDKATKPLDAFGNIGSSIIDVLMSIAKRMRR